MDRSAANALPDFYAFVELFYRIIDPMSYFIKLEDAYDMECPPDYDGTNLPCGAGLNVFTERIGGYRRPQVAGEGTGFYFMNTVEGDAENKQLVNIGFTAPYPLPCPPKPCIPAEALNDRYFIMNVDAATGQDDIIWYNVDNQGVQPVVQGNGGPQTYHAVAIDLNDEWPTWQSKTDAVVVATGNWIKAQGNAVCYDISPITYGKCTDLPPNDPCASVVPCPFSNTSAYEAAVIGPRIETRDGDGGFESGDTTMYASDTTVLATNLVTDDEWQDAHNMTKVPYEKGLGIDIMYLLGVSELLPCPPLPCAPAGYFINTVVLGVLNQMQYNIAGNDWPPPPPYRLRNR